MITLTNDSPWEARVDPDNGAELNSLGVPFAGDRVEVLYRGGERSTGDGWQGRAPILWPAVGRSFTRQHLAAVRSAGEDPIMGSIEVEGTTYPMPRHGFAMRNRWQVESVGSSRCVLSLEDDEDTRAPYPYGFRIESEYRLEAASLALTVRIRGKDGPLPFAIGNHMSFGIPLSPPSDPEAILIKTPATKRMESVLPGMLTGGWSREDFSRPVPLGRANLYNSVLGGFSADDCYVDVRDPGGLGLRVCQAVSASDRSLVNPNYLLFVFYGSIDRGFYCAEPWYGKPNALNTSDGLTILPPGEEFRWKMTVQTLP